VLRARRLLAAVDELARAELAIQVALAIFRNYGDAVAEVLEEPAIREFATPLRDVLGSISNSSFLFLFWEPEPFSCMYSNTLASIIDIHRPEYRIQSPSPPGYFLSIF